MLYAQNNLWEEARRAVTKDLSNENNSGRIDLSHSSIRDLRIKNCFGTAILAPLKLNELDLSYSDFNHFNQLGVIDVKVINITGCRIISEISEYWIKQLKESGVETFIVDPRGLPDYALELLKKYFNVIDGTQ